MTAKWVRGHTPPRRYLRGGTFIKLTPRGQWMYDRSRERWEKNFPDDAAYWKARPIVAEIGSVEQFLFICSPEIK